MMLMRVLQIGWEEKEEGRRGFRWAKGEWKGRDKQEQVGEGIEGQPPRLREKPPTGRFSAGEPKAPLAMDDNDSDQAQGVRSAAVAQQVWLPKFTA